MLFSRSSMFYLTLATLSSTPSFLLPQSLWQELSFLSSHTIRLQWIYGHSFPPGNDAADELVRQEVLIVFSATPCSLASLISRIRFSLFLDWGHTVSSKFFGIQVPPRSLCSLSSTQQRTQPAVKLLFL